MTQRLTKPNLWCKAALAAMALLTSAAWSDDTARSLRDCVARAKGAGAVSVCEQQHRVRLKQNITHLREAIRAHLDRQQRLVFDRSTEAWSVFLERESAMLSLSLGQRKDGLASKLEQGGITRLYEQREGQLREHLHNLSVSDTRKEPDGE